MKKFRFLIWLSVLCLLVAGCKNTEEPAGAEHDSTLGSTVAETLPTLTAQRLTFQNSGKQRIAYTGNRNSVQYITSVSQLPDNEVFQQYDEAFFKEHGLVLVIQTVSSGSVQIDIDAIFVSGSTAAVSLSHSMPGENSTTDMATWYLWAEVDAGLDLDWTLAGTVKNDSLEIHTH